MGARALDRSGNGIRGLIPQCCQVVVLDEHHIEQAEAMVSAAAARNRVLLQPPPTRCGLARVENLRPRVFDCINKLGRQGGDAAEPLQEVEGDSFSTQQRASSARDLQQGLAPSDPLGVLRGIRDPHFSVERPKGRFGQSQTSDHQRLARSHHRFSLGDFGHYGQCCHIAAADVLCQSGRYSLTNLFCC